VVLGVLLFITYHFLGVFAENYAKQGNISPVLGAWLSTLVTFPLSIFLTSRATADRGLVNFGESLINLKDAFKFKLKKEIED
jgi:lipopolysaccharide export system permease protein